MHTVFQLVVIHRTASSECVLQGAKNIGIQRVLNQGCREDDDLIQLPVCLNPSNSLL